MPYTYTASALLSLHAQFFCPPGSGAPIRASPGFFTLGESGTSSTHPWLGVDRTRTQQEECLEGHFCVDGFMYKCPAGRFGGWLCGMLTPQWELEASLLV
jgi:hypothetical protein